MRRSYVEKMICVPLGSEFDIKCPIGQPRSLISSQYDCPTFIILSLSYVQFSGRVFGRDFRRGRLFGGGARLRRVFRQGLVWSRARGRWEWPREEWGRREAARATVSGGKGKNLISGLIFGAQLIRMSYSFLPPVQGQRPTGPRPRQRPQQQ